MGAAAFCSIVLLDESMEVLADAVFAAAPSVLISPVLFEEIADCVVEVLDCGGALVFAVTVFEAGAACTAFTAGVATVAASNTFRAFLVGR